MNKSFFIFIFVVIPGVLFSQNIDKRVISAFVDIEKEHYANAIDSLNVLLKTNSDPDLYLAKAEAFYNNEEIDKALEVCYQLDKLRPSYSSALKFEIYLNQQDKENAVEALNENAKSRYKISLFNLLNSEEYVGLYTLELDEHILSGNYYSKTEKQIYQVERLVQQGKSSQALFLIDQMLLVKHNIADAHYFKSKILLNNDDLQGAIQAINTAIDLKSSILKYYKLRSEIYTQLQKFDEALEDIDKVIRIESYTIDNYIAKANILFDMENFTEAIELTAAIVDILPENEDVQYLSCKANYKEQNYFEALKIVNQLLQHNSDKMYFELRGDIYSATNMHQYAVQDYSMYLDIEPYNGDVYAKKGLARYSLGDNKGACSDWEKGKRYGSYKAVRYLEKHCE